MADLDQYKNGGIEQEQEQMNLGDNVLDKAKGKAKETAKKPFTTLRKKATEKIRNAAGGKGLKKAAADKAKKVAEKGLKGAAKVVLASPAGWIGIGVLLLFGSALSDAFTDPETQVAEDMAQLLVSEDGNLSDDGVAVLMGDCPELTVAGDDGAVGPIDKKAAMEANAKLVYSVFKTKGLSDVMIAGILGNMEHETDIVDPTCIECIYNEPNTVGPRKQQAFADLNAWTTGTVFAKYEAGGVSISKPGYRGKDGKYYCGIGLIQWTGEGAETMLAVASNMNQTWYSMQFQLAYMYSDAHYRKGFFEKWMNEPSESVADAAYYFAKWYEGNTSNGARGRIEKAEQWLPIIKTWSVDTAYAESVTALATTMGGASTDKKVADKAANCGTDTAGVFDNSTLASAMVSYAYPTVTQAHNDGTELYQRVHRVVFPGDRHFKSCDRSVACAVRWSGSDDTYPSGNTNYQYVYLKSSDKWQSVGKAGSLTLDDLLPGDVFIVNGHTFMYVGTDLIQQFHAGTDPSYNSVSGSLEDWSPACDASTSSILGRGGQDWNGHGEYEVFRCVKPDNSTTYKDAGTSAVVS